MTADSARDFDRPLVAWLGDDFTGAAAVMEVLSFAGLPSILFLSQPTPEQLATFGPLAGIGIATLARSRSPDWMQEHLSPLFAFLDGTGAELVHYKICSTLDSSPQIGSIGKAIEIGRSRFGKSAIPVVTAAPEMRRYQAFGTLFCAFANRVHRLDRHPVMAHHPVTPMTEADVARHLSFQTEIPTGCVDLEALANGTARHLLDEVPNIWTIDMMTAGHQAQVGELLWERRRDSRFVVGSQGVEFALTAYFRQTGLLGSPDPPRGLGRNDRMAVVSGSVSPTSAVQIAWARANGFAAIKLDAAALCRDDAAGKEAEITATDAAMAALNAGKPPLVYTAEGTDDPALAEVRAAAGGDISGANDRIGRSLGRILKTVIAEKGLRRVAVSGGDTSGHVCETLGIYALEAAAPTIPGAAICRAKAEGAMNGLEIALKGGQMGSPDYFGWIREGGGARA